jgi:hypothetical protein
LNTPATPGFPFGFTVGAPPVNPVGGALVKKSAGWVMSLALISNAL